MVLLAGFGSAGCCRAGGISLGVSKALGFKGVQGSISILQVFGRLFLFSVVFTNDELILLVSLVLHLTVRYFFFSLLSPTGRGIV